MKGHYGENNLRAGREGFRKCMRRKRSVSDSASHLSIDFAIAHLTEREAKSKVHAPEAAGTITAATSREEAVVNAESSMRYEIMLVLDHGSLENVDFDERLSQQI
jgi:hypothetical protein